MKTSFDICRQLQDCCLAGATIQKESKIEYL